MNWNLTSFDWNQARSFLAVAEARSISEAADALGCTQPTVSRQIAVLEKDLQVALFERSGRSLALTPVGLDLLDHVRSMADAANRISLSASGQSQAIEGLVRVTASEMTAAYVLPNAIDKLSTVAPNLRLDILAENKVSDLLLREADIAVRHIRPEEPSLIAKLVCEDPARFYAVPRYIDTYGIPKLDGTMSQHSFVSYGDVAGMLQHLDRHGVSLRKENFRYISKSQIVEWEIARRGHGIAIMTDRIAAQFPEFQPVLTEVEPFSIPIWLVAHRDLHTSRRVRLVFDLLADCLSPIVYRHG